MYMYTVQAQFRPAQKISVHAELNSLTHETILSPLFSVEYNKVLHVLRNRKPHVVLK